MKAIHTPSVLALTRQNLVQLEGSTIERAALGGYVLKEAQDAKITIVATGSEVAIAVDAAGVLAGKGISARIVSMPCTEVFDQQSREYQLSVLPDGHPILSVEAYSVCIDWNDKKWWKCFPIFFY